MKAIQVKVLRATNFKGARVKAWIEGGESITQGWNYELETYSNACEAAYTLAIKLKWDVKLVGGGLPNGDWVFVVVETGCALGVA